MRRKGERGQVLPLIAIGLTAVLGFGGVAVDNGYWQYTLRQQQSAADGAALGAAQALQTAGCSNQAAAQAAASADAASNGYAGGTAVTVVAHNPPTSGAYTSDPCAVSVQIGATHASFLTKVLGRANMPETTAATATLVSNNSNCIYLLSPSATSTFEGGNVTAPSCGVMINGPSIFSGSQTINVGSIGYGGTPPSISGTKFTGATPKASLPVPNPCSEIKGCSYLANNPPPATSCQSLKANMNATIAPGCYTDLTIGTCGTVTLLPGTYVLNGTSDFSNTDFVGTGVTFYVTSSGTPPNFSTAHSASISPPTTGNEANVLYYQVPSNTGAPNLSGSSLRFSGLVYAPGAIGATFNGAQGDYSVLVFGSANLNSSSGYSFGAPPAGNTIAKNAVLVQ